MPPNEPRATHWQGCVLCIGPVRVARIAYRISETSVDVFGVPALSTTTLEQEVHRRRVWYHDVELSGGVRTRIPEDYKLNPVLRAVDEGNRKVLTWLESQLPVGFGGETVLDLGCADGLFSIWAARRGASHVLGIERNRPNFDRACFLSQALSLPHVEFAWTSLEEHRPDSPWDNVFCLGLLYHLVEPLRSLHRLRSVCKRRLLLTCAVDLPQGDGSPISRLDRYATGAHGVWSFNVPMIRQLLSTAGFDIAIEDFEPRESGGRFVALCVPGRFEHHHIFDNRIDQEFPVNLIIRRQRVRELWKKLAARGAQTVALFGGGTHTPWMLEQVSDIDGIEVVCVLDDRVPPGQRVAGLPVRRPTEIASSEVSAVVISTWHQHDALRRRATEVFQNRIPVVS